MTADPCVDTGLGSTPRSHGGGSEDQRLGLCGSDSRIFRPHAKTPSETEQRRGPGSADTVLYRLQLGKPQWGSVVEITSLALAKSRWRGRRRGQRCWPPCVQRFYSFLPSFQRCGISSLTLPHALINFGEYAFADCTNLTSVVYRAYTPGT